MSTYILNNLKNKQVVMKNNDTCIQCQHAHAFAFAYLGGLAYRQCQTKPHVNQFQPISGYILYRYPDIYNNNF